MTDKQIITKSQMIMRIAELSANLIAKEQECERLKKELQKNFEEKDTLHLIIDRLLEASGYDTNTASAEDFEDVYEHMRYEQQQLDQLKAENEVLEKVNKTNQEKIKKLNEQLEEEFIAKQYGDMALFWKVEDYKQTLTEIKEICNSVWGNGLDEEVDKFGLILQKCEVLDE